MKFNQLPKKVYITAHMALFIAVLNLIIQIFKLVMLHNNFEITFLITIIISIFIVFIIFYLLYLFNSFNNSVIFRITELESLNKKFYKDYLSRTKQLQNSFESQAQSVHSEAIMGSIAQPMLHDISAPLSALELAFKLIDSNKISKENEEILFKADESVKQIIRIVEDARDLMSNNKKEIKFNGEKIIAKILLVLSSKCDKFGIKINLNVNTDIFLKGIPVLFERVIINLVINAIEELNNSNKDVKEINIFSIQEDNKIKIVIEDNGRGIPKEYIPQLFKHNFSSKHNIANLGFGLTFVKNTIEKYFNGTITLETNEGMGTKFIITLPFLK